MLKVQWRMKYKSLLVVEKRTLKNYRQSFVNIEFHAQNKNEIKKWFKICDKKNRNLIQK